MNFIIALIFLLLASESLQKSSYTSTIGVSSSFPHYVSSPFTLKVTRGSSDSEFVSIVIREDEQILQKVIVDLSKNLSLSNGTWMKKLCYQSNEAELKIWFSRRSHSQLLEVYSSADPESANSIYHRFINLAWPPTLNLKVWTEFNGSSSSGSKQQQQQQQQHVIQCRSKNGIPPKYPYIHFMALNISDRASSRSKEKTAHELVTTVRLQAHKKDDGAEVRCQDKGVMAKANIVVYSHPDKVVISPSPLYSVARGDILDCKVFGGRSNVSSLSWTVYVDKIKQKSQNSPYTSSESLGPRRSQLTLTRAADWATLRVICEAVSTVNRDTKIIRHELPPLLIRPENYPQEIENSTNSLIQSMNRKFAALQRGVDVANPGQFVWKVEDLSKKIENAKRGVDIDIHSPVFSSSQCGYQMRLLIYPNGFGADEGSHLSVFFQIMKGKFDAVQKWPMKESVKIAIVNQDNGYDFEGQKYDYHSTEENNQFVFLRPQNEANVGLGNSKFISHATLMESRAAVKGDTIFIRCIVTAPP